MASKRQTTQQRRAAHAWDRIQQVEEQGGDTGKYGTLARRLPALIQINGLGSVMAFLIAKGGNKRQDAHNLIYGHLSDWVTEEVDTQQKHTKLMDLVRLEDMNVYRRATTEAIEYAIWLKRYVEAKEWGSAQDD